MENSSTEDVKQLIRREMRLQNLDSLLLFISSAFGFFFSFIYIFFGYFEVAVGFIPIIILGTFIPIYIGYIRGAILLDNIEERMRGWIYLITGVITYIAFALFASTNKLIGQIWQISSPYTEAFTDGLLLVGGFFLGFFLAKAHLGDRVCEYIFKIFKQKATILTDEIYQKTEFSTFQAAIFIYLSLSIVLFYYGTFGVIEWVVFFLLPHFYVALVLVTNERKVRNLIILNKHSNSLEVERQLIKSSSPRLRATGIILVIVGGTLYVLAPIMEIILPIFTSRLIAIVFSGAGSSLYTLSREEHEIIANIKEDVSIPEEVKKEIEPILERMK